MNSSVKNMIMIAGVAIFVSVLSLAWEHFSSIKELVILNYRSIIRF